MKILSLDTSAPASLPRGAAVALGFFDGVHRGHLEIIAEAVRLSLSARVPCAVWMISRRGEDYKGGSPLLTSEEDKLSLLRKAGADFAVLSDFDSVRSMTGEEFVRDFLCRRLGVSAVVCGYNFRFGAGAAWGESELSRLCGECGITCKILPEVRLDNESVSSSRIRALISAGDVEAAARLLGRPYSVTLPVLEGKRLGRQLGFPTVNQVIPRDRVSPKIGVYAVKVVLPDGTAYPGAANIGHCPTVDREISASAEGGAATEERAVCETYIVGFSGDLYGKDVEIRFLERLRGEKKFDSLHELKRQIEADATTAERMKSDFVG